MSILDRTSGTSAPAHRTFGFLFAMLVVLGISSKASAAVAVDGVTTSSSSNTASVTFAKTVGAGANRLLIVGVSTKTNQTASSITYGGVALTKVASIQNADWAEMWRLVAPATGTANVIVTLAGAAAFSAGAISFTGVDQGAPIGSVDTGMGTSVAPSNTVSSRVGDMVFDVIKTQDTSAPTAGGSQTGRWSVLQTEYGVASTQPGAAGYVTSSWTTANKKWSEIIANIRAAGVSPGQFISGSYTGNATDATAISAQIGFEPDMVLIKGETAQEAAVQTATMDVSYAKPMTTNTALTAGIIEGLNGISGLSQGGFTLGTDARVNSNTLTYDYVALTSKAGEVFMGSYFGNGADNTPITGVGFQPDVVMVFSDLNVAAVWRTSSMVGDVTVQFNNVASFNHCLKSLDADGFTLGTNTQCNGALSQYHYVAWKATTSKLAVGTWTGVSAQDNRNIALAAGFGVPDWVMANDLAAGDTVQKMAVTTQSTDTACYFRNIICAANTIQALQTDGFQVGTTLNANTTVYYYIAFSHRSSATAVKLASFTATTNRGDTLLKWRTGYEVDNLGFNVYREEHGVRKRLTPSLVGGSGLMVAPTTKTTAALSYQWLDREAIAPNATVTYWLEDVDLNGTRTLHGPIVPVVGIGKTFDVQPSIVLPELAKPTTQKLAAESPQ